MQSGKLWSLLGRGDFNRPLDCARGDKGCACGAVRTALLAGLLLVAIIVVAYLPTSSCKFVWVDSEMLLNNLVLQENGLFRSWFTTDQTNYWPVTWTSYWLEYQIWGLNPTGYHIVNVVLHIFCSLLIWRILLRLKIPCAWLAAVIFAVHPVNVESVAWITQRKNILPMFFFLVAILFYLRFDDSERRRFYWLAVAAFVLAMLSKGSVAPLPVVLLLFAWWLHGRIGIRDLVRSVPFFAVSGFFSIVEIWFQYTKAMGGGTVQDANFFSRLAGAGWIVAFYFYKAVLPVNLSFIYHLWKIDSTDLLSYVPVLSMFGLAVLFWRYRRSWGKAPLFALAYYVVMLLPVLGFIDIYFMKYSLVADHYQYVAIIAVITLVLAIGYSFAKQQGKLCLKAAGIIAASVVVMLSILTWRQCHIYQDSETLWRDTLKKNTTCWMPYYRFGVVLANRGKFDEAIESYHKALALSPDDGVGVYNNLGSIYFSQGKLEHAIAQFNLVLQIKPDMAVTHNNLGLALVRQGKIDEAIEHLQMAVHLAPNYARAHNNLAKILVSVGKINEAVKHRRQALIIRPNWLKPMNALAWLLATTNDPEISNAQEAIQFGEKACELTGYKDAGTVDTLAIAYAAAGRFSEAVATAQKALKLSQSAGDKGLSEEIRSHLELFKAGQPYRER